MGVDVFGRVISANVAFCMQKSRQVYICRAFLAFFSRLLSVFSWGRGGLVWVRSLGCGFSDWVKYGLLVLRRAEVGRVFEGVIIARIGGGFWRNLGEFCADV